MDTLGVEAIAPCKVLIDGMGEYDGTIERATHGVADLLV
jgi:hypothetical protein